MDSVAEHGAEGFAHAGDEGDLRLLKAAFGELCCGPVFESAEQPVLRAGGTGDPDLVVAAHGPVHGLPPAAAAKLRRWRLPHRLEDREDGRLTFSGQAS